jgi:hypothetical protein
MPEIRDIQVQEPAARVAAASDELQDMQGEKMVLNMGPSHGVLRIVLELDRTKAALLEGRPFVTIAGGNRAVECKRRVRMSEN